MTDARQIAAPVVAVGDMVDYNDRHHRVQGNCRVLSITAYWTQPNRAPLIVYEVEHPTYRNGRAPITAADIIPRFVQ